ncbi:MAG: hypothetical protein H6Q55_496 [Deltaproteobacteria bacterium]|nr:hypothetical protein [Deltaproteobacteria bacterium]
MNAIETHKQCLTVDPERVRSTRGSGLLLAHSSNFFALKADKYIVKRLFRIGVTEKR